MALSPNDKEVLEQIVDVNGQCLDHKRCLRCPFRAICLPEFLNPVPPSQPQRLQMAIDVLAHHTLIADDEDEQEDFRWSKK